MRPGAEQSIAPACGTRPPGSPTGTPPSTTPAGIQSPSTSRHLLPAPVFPQPPGRPRPPAVQPTRGRPRRDGRAPSPGATKTPRTLPVAAGRAGDSTASATRGDTRPKAKGTRATRAFYRRPAWATRPRPPARRCPAAQRGGAERQPPRGTRPCTCPGPFWATFPGPGGVGRLSPDAAPLGAAGNGPTAPCVPREAPSACWGCSALCVHPVTGHSWGPHGAGSAVSPRHALPRRHAPRPRC